MGSNERKHSGPPIQVVLGTDTEIVLGFRTVLLADPKLGTLTETYYWLRYANGKPINGQTDAKGQLRVRTDWGDFVDIAIQARVKTRGIRVMLTKDPTSTPKGAWARLVNLGYVDMDQPPVEPTEEQLEQALRRFQTKTGLPRTGKLEGATPTRLDHDGRSV